MNGNPELSIIVPVYKSEPYLRACIDSVIAQTFSDWELILVDDGSPDDSGRICDEYADKDGRIVVIHKENAGPGAARNDALDMARGRYVTFIDSDDEYGTADTLEKNMAILSSDGSIDMLQYPHVYLKKNRKHLSMYRNERLSSKKDILSAMLEDKVNGYMCMKIFKAELFDGLRIPEDVRITEDLRLLISMFERVRCVYLSGYGVYRYYKRDNSLVVSKSMEKELACAETYRRLLALVDEYQDVDRISVAKRFFRTFSHLLKISVSYGCDIKDKLNAIMPYMPDDSLLLSCRLKLKYKWKIIQIKILGIERFAKLKIFLKRRKLG